MCNSPVLLFVRSELVRNKSGADWERVGHHSEGWQSQETAGSGVHDEFMSHIIGWQPCCADCGNRFSLGAEETLGLHWDSSLSFISMASSWPAH